MRIADYADGRPLTFDSSTREFTIGGTPVTRDDVKAYDAWGQLTWVDDDTRAQWLGWIGAPVAPVMPAKAPSTGRRPGVVAAIVLLALGLVVGGIYLFIRVPSKTVVVTLTVEGAPLNEFELERLRLVELHRARSAGLSVKSMSPPADGRIVLEVSCPADYDSAQLVALLGSSGRLEFVDVASITDSAIAAQLMDTAKPAGEVSLKEGTYSAFIDGSVITNAKVGTDSTGRIDVSVSMNAEGTRKWAEYTASHVGKQVAIVLDGVVKSAPVINEPITGGDTSISGSFTADEAKRLSVILQSGQLPGSVSAVVTDSGQ